MYITKQRTQNPLVTDGRMSGASGKTPSIIHVVPEAGKGGLLSKIKSGDLMSININEGTIDYTDKNIEKRKSRIKNFPDLYGNGRELFKQYQNEFILK